jgi:hypothetical protein
LSIIDSKYRDYFLGSYIDAREQTRGSNNRDRSSQLVESIAAQLRALYCAPEYWTFSRGHDLYRNEFKLNELSFDVQVCEIAYDRIKDLPFVKRSIWQIESELRDDSRESLIDFSKLVTGAATNKLFVGPLVHRSRQVAFRDCLLEPARECNANTYAFFIPEPSLWFTPEEVDKKAEFYKYHSLPDRWELIEGKL